jgi:hypothetical protein
MPSVENACSDATRWGPLTYILKGLALGVPWGIIEIIAGSRGYPGYTVGLFIGLLCMYVVPPRDVQLWRFLILGIVMSIVHPLIAIILPKTWLIR